MRKKVRNERRAREKLGMILDMPLDIIKGCSRMTVIGNESVLLENYKGIISYEFNGQATTKRLPDRTFQNVVFWMQVFASTILACDIEEVN